MKHEPSDELYKLSIVLWDFCDFAGMIKRNFVCKYKILKFDARYKYSIKSAKKTHVNVPISKTKKIYENYKGFFLC